MVNIHCFGKEKSGGIRQTQNDIYQALCPGGGVGTPGMGDVVY